MSKRKYDTHIVNTRPLKQPSVYTQAQQQAIYNRAGFIQGGRIMRNPAFKNAVKSANALKNAKEVKGCDGIMNIALNSLLNTTSTNGSMFVANCVQPGSGSWNRIGRKIRMKSLRLKGTILNRVSPGASTQTISQNTFRISVVFDKQPSSGAIPSFDTIFGATDQSGTEATLSVLDSLKYDNTERFSVLKDHVITSDNYPVPNPSVSDWQQEFDLFIPLKGLETVYSGQSNPCTIADISSGALYIIVRATKNLNVDGVGAITNSSVRLRYYD